MASISSLFGYILNFIYETVQNYGLAIIIFSILLKLLLLPLSIKQHKTMKKTAKMQEKLKEIQEKYKNNQQKVTEETMALYKKENMSPFSGCLSSILQIVILLAMFLLVRNPLTYMLKIDQNIVDGVTKYISLESEENKVDKAYPQISILKYVSNNKDKVIDINIEEKEEVEEQEEIIEVEENTEIENETIEDKDEKKEEQLVNLNDLYINMKFLGMDLSNIPKENWDDLTVFIIPVLYVLTSIISMKLTTNLTKVDKKEEIIEIKKVDDKEEKEQTQEDMTNQMNKSMTWFMPVMSVSISLIAPLGLALYWLVNNVLMIIERVVLNKFLEQKEEEEQNG